MVNGYHVIDKFYGDEEDKEHGFIEFLKDIYDDILYIFGFYDLEYMDSSWSF